MNGVKQRHEITWKNIALAKGNIDISGWRMWNDTVYAECLSYSWNEVMKWFRDSRHTNNGNCTPKQLQSVVICRCWCHHCRRTSVQFRLPTMQLHFNPETFSILIHTHTHSSFEFLFPSKGFHSDCIASFSHLISKFLMHNFLRL